MKGLLFVICVVALPLQLFSVQISSFRDWLPGQNVGNYGGIDGSEFVFARLIYSDGARGLANFRGFRGGGSWRTDWPEADKHLTYAIERMSNVRVVMDQDIAIEIMDPNLFSYPFLYALEVGRGMDLSPEEADRLREFMERGGFLVIDDFWGTREWQNWAYQLSKIFPEKEPEQIPIAHPLFHSFFDIEEIIQVPNVSNGCYGGPTYERDGYVPYALGIFDDDRRLMMLINYNTDIGDAWEHADQPCYPNEFANYAFRIAINYIIYSMTH